MNQEAPKHISQLPKCILVVDDELNLRRVLKGMLVRLGYHVVCAENGKEALERLTVGDIQTVFTDLKMPIMDGMQLLDRATDLYPQIPIVILTAHGSVDSAVAAVKCGAFDYLEKPFDKLQIEQVTCRAVKTYKLRCSETQLVRHDSNHGRFGIIGVSAAMKPVFNAIEKVAQTPSTVLITGESGTGKELVAKALHDHSERQESPFIKVNCAAIPSSLLESELFGHERGAFTGAVSAKPGRFELADKGTLFLDEVGEIPLEMQAKLLRALQDGSFERVGGIKTINVNVRVVAATNRNLIELLEKGTFREDLYYRLNVVPVHLPPLRQRYEDIPYLVDHILTQCQHRFGERSLQTVSADALHTLCSYTWPGNIRELENLIERATLFCETSQLEYSDLPEHVCHAEPISMQHPALMVGADGTERTQWTDPSTSHNGSLKEIVKAETLRIERRVISAALDQTGGNVTHAAKRLQISRKSLQIKMKELGLRHQDIKPQ